jgi:hypothetical protein
MTVSFLISSRGWIQSNSNSLPSFFWLALPHFNHSFIPPHVLSLHWRGKNGSQQGNFWSISKASYQALKNAAAHLE